MGSIGLAVLTLILGYSLGRRRRRRDEAAELVEVIGPAEVQAGEEKVHVDAGARFVISVDRLD